MPYFLPQKYNFLHNYCFFLHNLLTKIVKQGEANNKFSVKFSFKNGEIPQSFVNLKGEKLYNWMISNGYTEQANELTYKQVFVATLSDFCHFVHTALICSEKRKLTVTYSLLRKPFKDNLLILEWLLADPTTFLNKFNSKEITGDLAIDRMRPNEKIEIVKSALDKIQYSLHSADFLYNIRYNKQVDYGLERLWQKANHIITSSNYVQTEEGNLNFIFSGNEAHTSQWDRLYMLLPSLLFYTKEVCKMIYFGIIANDEQINEADEEKAVLGFIVSSYIRNKSSTLQGLSELQDLNILTCQECGNSILLNDEKLELLSSKSILMCTCGSEKGIFT